MEAGRVRRRGLRAVAVAAVLALAAGAAPPLASLGAPGGVTLVSSTSDGLAGDAGSWGPALSADGQAVAFISSAKNLVAGDTNDEPDVFLARPGQSAIQRVTPPGADGPSTDAAISADGRYVVYVSEAANIVASDANGAADVFRFDTASGETVRVSEKSGGTGDADGASSAPAVSADGNRIAFESTASNLVADDANGAPDVFLWDASTLAVTRVSVPDPGTGRAEATGASTEPAISGDGTVVAFTSSAEDLTDDDADTVADVFVADAAAATLRRVSKPGAGADPAPADSHRPALRSDGAAVAFTSAADLTGTGPESRPAGTETVYVADLAAATLEPVVSPRTPVAAAPERPALSADGRTVAVVGAPSGSETGHGRHVLVVDRTCRSATTVTVNGQGEEASSPVGNPALALAGTTVAFDTAAANLAPDDANDAADVFTAETAPPPTDCPPLATLKAVPAAGIVPLPVAFDAAASVSPTGVIVDYAWDFGDGTPPAAGPHPTTAHNYAPPRVHVATVTVTDTKAATATAAAVVLVLGANTAPDAVAAAEPGLGPAPLAVILDASATTDADGDAVTGYTWDFGDGTPPVAGPDPTTAHTFTGPGVYVARLTATDARGATGQASVAVVVLDADGPPEAAFTFSPDSGPVPLEVTFDAGASADPGGGVVGYAWDFGDGSPPETHQTPTTVHSYAQTGVYVPVLTVTDTAGKADTLPAAWPVFVAKGAQNAPPAADFTASAEDGEAPLDVDFTDTSSDPDGAVTEAQWDFGDGATATGPAPGHTYTTPGRYEVLLRVVDDDGADSWASGTIAVRPANRPPEPAFDAEPGGGRAPLDVTFDALASTDPDGVVAGFAWDFGDGTAGTGERPTHTYASPGTFTPILTVTDDRGASATKEGAPIDVSPPNRPPVARIASDILVGPSPYTVDLDGTASSDPDPDGSITTYEWNFGDGSPPASGPTATHTFGGAGVYFVTLAVTDDSGGRGSVELPVGVHVEATADTRPVVSVAGAGSFTSPSGTGGATVTYDVRRVGTLPLHFGAIRLVDPGSGITDSRCFVLTWGGVRPDGLNGAKAPCFGLAFARGGLRFFSGTWTVDDRSSRDFGADTATFDLSGGIGHYTASGPLLSGDVVVSR